MTPQGWTLQEWKEFAQIVAWFSAAASALVAVGLLTYTVIKDAGARRHQAYDELDNKYLDFLKLCLEHPHLEVYDVPWPSGAAELSDDQKKEMVILTYLCSVFERAFILYKGSWWPGMREQWRLWDAYLHAWAERENFRCAWKFGARTLAPDPQDSRTGFRRGVRSLFAPKRPSSKSGFSDPFDAYVEGLLGSLAHSGKSVR